MQKRTFVAVIVALAVIALVRVASTHRVYSATLDEPIHLGCGYEWFDGTYTTDMTHPPLARVICALPLRLAHFPELRGTNMVDRGNQLLYFGNRYTRTLARGRMGNLLLFALAITVVALWTSFRFGREVAVAAVALFTNHPLVLGHAGLITTDMALTATLPLALFALDRLFDAPSLRRGAVLGVAIGLGLLSKFSFVVFFPVCAIVLLFLHPVRRIVPRSLAVALIVAGVVTWGGYRFHVAQPASVIKDGDTLLENSAPKSLRPLARGLSRLPLPAPELFLGLAQVKAHDILGHG